MIAGLDADQMRLRKFTLGASEVAAVCGLNPWKSAHDVWLVKRGLADEVGDARTRMGLRVEAAIAQEYCESEGAKLAHFGTVVHPTESWMSATPDACVSGARRLLEIKNVGWRVAHHWGTKPDAIPDYYRPQAEWQMEVCDADECHFAAWIGGTDFRIYPIKRDPELAAMFKAIARRFWFDHVLTGIAPPVDHTDGARRMLGKLFPRNMRPLASATPQAAELAAQLIEARAKAAEAEKVKESLENRMRECIGDGEGFKAEDWKVTWKADKNGKRTLKFKTAEEAA